MKKNKFMRIASVLLIVTLLSTSVISGTFAKYTTEAEGSDSATVAKWGVNLLISGDLFGKTYKGTATTDTNGLTVSAASSNTNNVVAPGTKNDTGLTFKVEGTPEVAGKITTKITYKDIFLAAGTYGVMVQAQSITAANFAELKNSLYTESSGSYFAVGTDATFDSSATYYILRDKVTLSAQYNPVKFTVGSGSASSLADAAVAIAQKFISETSSYTSGTAIEKTFTPNTTLNIADTLKWSWEFANSENSNNGADTILGMLADSTAKVVKLDSGSYKGLTEGTDYNLKVEFKIEITVEQTTTTA